jgi:hydroxyacylglutathione hydrolase
VEPENEQLIRRTREVEELRAAGLVTIPSILGEELMVNPFLRCRQASVVSAAQNRKPGVQAGAGTLAVIRAWKDGF